MSYLLLNASVMEYHEKLVNLWNTGHKSNMWHDFEETSDPCQVGSQWWEGWLDRNPI